MKYLEVSLNEKEHKRIFNKIKIDKITNCWNWTGAKDYGGYGQGFYRGNKERVHRIVYAFYKGKIPRGRKYQLDHLCKNTSCSNPEHLELVTQKVNVIRGNGITAKNARKTHCKYGHKLPEYKLDSKRKFCKTCDSIRHKKRMSGVNREYWLHKNNEAVKRYYWKHKKT